MNSRNSILVALMATTGIAMASSNRIDIEQAVGPEPVESKAQTGDGILQVFSANEMALPRATASDVFEKNEVKFDAAHTDYAIYDNNGKLVRKVINSKHRNDSSPALVKLGSGQYKVVAKAQTDNGWTITCTIPVVIEAGGKTVVHLEPDWRPSNKLVQYASLVRGHDGRIIGFLAAQ